ncbi:MAG: hypothetical protein ACTSQ8_07820 [Candidatus Helarchaeota archaeon]
MSNKKFFIITKRETYLLDEGEIPDLYKWDNETFWLFGKIHTKKNTLTAHAINLDDIKRIESVSIEIFNSLLGKIQKVTRGLVWSKEKWGFV